ncbi:hypothetical protein GCM10009608_07350 [Pseudonocardia alaniniphila]
MDRRLSHHQDKPPVLRTGDDPPPPAREQLPLPRRRRQAHLEPQLRNPGNNEAGTPFAAFATQAPAPEAAPREDPQPEPSTPPSGSDVAAAFHSATRRGRLHRRPQFFEGRGGGRTPPPEDQAR